MKKTLTNLVASALIGAGALQGCGTLRGFNISSTLGDVMTQAVTESQEEYQEIDESNLTQEQQSCLNEYNTQLSNLSKEQKQAYLIQSIGPDSFLQNFLGISPLEFGDKEKVFLMQNGNTPYQSLKPSQKYNQISLEDLTKKEEEYLKEFDINKLTSKERQELSQEYPWMNPENLSKKDIIYLYNDVCEKIGGLGY
jgi:hypothetical protein